MPDEPDTAPEAVSTSETVIIVPPEPEPTSPSVDERLSVIEARLTDIASSLSAHVAQHEEGTEDDGTDGTDDTGDDRGSAEEEEGATESEQPRTGPKWFRKLW